MSEKESKYAYKRKQAWDELSHKAVHDFCEGYKKFLDSSKTEREAVHHISTAAKKASKKCIVRKAKAAAILIAGKKPVEDGVKILISHTDSPRLDLKQMPLYEDGDSNLALFETHYYGGIKKYHWLAVPLALHGVIVLKNGDKVDISIGERAEDPVFTVADLLPHLAKEEQADKKLSEAISAESLDIIVGGLPAKGDVKAKLTEAVLEKLHADYGMTEEDFVSAELQAVPAAKARDVGFDRSMVGAYGQDDKACVYASLCAVLETTKPEHAVIALFVDKEEIGSEGNSGAQSDIFLRSLIRELDPKADVDKTLMNSRALSADVNSAITPNYKNVFEVKNCAAIGKGVVLTKFTGSGGKYSANDASAEYVGEIRTMLNKHKVPWQTGELGKVDVGGGGTVSKYLARLGMDVIDLGPPVMSMHAPFEVTSKADIYSAYLAYKAFLSE